VTDVASEQRSDRRPRVLLLYYTYTGQALPGETSIRRCTFRPSQPRHAGVRLGTTLEDMLCAIMNDSASMNVSDGHPTVTNRSRTAEMRVTALFWEFKWVSPYPLCFEPR
jgi:hypothetical protein